MEKETFNSTSLIEKLQLNIYILKPDMLDASHVVEYLDIDPEYPFFSAYYICISFFKFQKLVIEVI